MYLDTRCGKRQRWNRISPPHPPPVPVSLVAGEEVKSAAGTPFLDFFSRLVLSLRFRKEIMMASDDNPSIVSLPLDVDVVVALAYASAGREKAGEAVASHVYDFRLVLHHWFCLWGGNSEKAAGATRPRGCGESTRTSAAGRSPSGFGLVPCPRASVLDSAIWGCVGGCGNHAVCSAKM